MPSHHRLAAVGLDEAAARANDEVLADTELLAGERAGGRRPHAVELSAALARRIGVRAVVVRRAGGGAEGPLHLLRRDPVHVAGVDADAARTLQGRRRDDGDL